MPAELAALVNNPQFAQLRQMVQENPALIQPMIQSLAASNPGLAQMLAANPDIMYQLLGGEGADGMGDDGDDEWEGGDDPMAAFAQGGHQSISVTAEENEAIQRVRPLLLRLSLAPARPSLGARPLTCPRRFYALRSSSRWASPTSACSKRSSCATATRRWPPTTCLTRLETSTSKGPVRCACPSRPRLAHASRRLHLVADPRLSPLQMTAPSPSLLMRRLPIPVPGALARAPSMVLLRASRRPLASRRCSCRLESRRNSTT